MFPLPKTIARFASRKTDSFCSTAKYLRDNLTHSHSKLKVPNHMSGTPVKKALTHAFNRKMTDFAKEILDSILVTAGILQNNVTQSGHSMYSNF